MDILTFLATKRGRDGFFLSLFEYTLCKDKQLAKVVKTIPRKWFSIMDDVGTHRFMIKVDGTCDPSGYENISIIICFISEDSKEVTERLLTMATADAGDTERLTDTILQELTTTGLSATKILSQCYDGASVVSGKHGGSKNYYRTNLAKKFPMYTVSTTNFNLWLSMLCRQL